ncbi:putative MFS family arabinose efflux permease [Constrictibacter sp. MBR-5]
MGREPPRSSCNRVGTADRKAQGADDAAVPGLSAKPRAKLLAPFAVRSFRFQWPADLSTSWAQEMETIILGWYVLVATESVLLLTVFASLQFGGTLVAPVFGLVGDRIGHRNLLCVMRASYAIFAATLTLLATFDALAPPIVFVIATLVGLVRPSDLVMRNALIGATIPPGGLMGAMSISRTTADSARVAGALAGAGLVATLGMAAAYAMITTLYATSFLLTLGVAGRGGDDGAAAPSVGRSSPLRDLTEAAASVWSTPHLLAAMSLAFLVNMTAFPLSGGLLPYVARDVYGADQTWLGYLVAGFASGGLVGSITLSRTAAAIRPARMMIVFAVVWYLLLLVFAQTQTAIAGVAVLMVAGFMQSLCMVPMSVMLVKGAPPRIRGRVMGLRMLAVYGLPVGLLVAGPMIAGFGFAATASCYAVLGLLLTLAIGLHWRAHLWGVDTPGNAP